MRAIPILSVCVVSVLFINVFSAVAQNDAGAKIRGDAWNGGAARTYQQHARDYGQFLYYQTKSDEGCTPEQAKQYTGAIRQNVQSANKALDKVQAAHAKDETVKKSVESIKKMHDKVLASCDTIDSEAKKDGEAKSVTICDCCVDLTGDLDKAGAETDKLLKHLKIDKLPEMKKSTDKTAPAKKADDKKAEKKSEK
jgi:hypothetical protein